VLHKHLAVNVNCGTSIKALEQDQHKPAAAPAASTTVLMWARKPLKSHAMQAVHILV
jgi:hypothetical protein